jgi:hypothetical protein
VGRLVIGHFWSGAVRAVGPLVSGTLIDGMFSDEMFSDRTFHDGTLCMCTDKTDNIFGYLKRRCCEGSSFLSPKCSLTGEENQSPFFL